MGEVFVGSVEECQGKEFAALFISTVRASRRWHEQYDRVFGVGILNDEKMMNTAITRAMALLVVVGDPYVVNTGSALFASKPKKKKKKKKKKKARR